MNQTGVKVYYIGLFVIVFLWIYVQPVYMPLSLGAGLFLGLTAIASWQYLCIKSFPADQWHCRTCGHDWTGHAKTQELQYIEECPKCPEGGANEETHH